jgi:hypothetical protein
MAPFSANRQPWVSIRPDRAKPVYSPPSFLPIRITLLWRMTEAQQRQASEILDVLNDCFTVWRITPVREAYFEL